MGKKRENKVAELIIVFVIAVLVVGGFIFFINKKNHSSDIDKEESFPTVEIELPDKMPTSDGNETEMSGEQLTEEQSETKSASIPSETEKSSAPAGTEAATVKETAAVPGTVTTTTAAETPTEKGQIQTPAATTAPPAPTETPTVPTETKTAVTPSKPQIETVGNPTVSDKTCTVYLQISDAYGNANIDDGYKGTYSGEWLDGKPNGAGTFFYTGNYFTAKQKEYLKIYGTWVDGKLTGKAVCTQVVHHEDVNLEVSNYSKFDFTQIFIGTFSAGYAEGTLEMYYGAAGGDALHIMNMKYKNGVVTNSDFQYEEWNFIY